MSQPTTPKPEGEQSRKVAADVLEAVLTRDRTLDQAVEDHPTFATLAPPDKAFARLLVLTCLRYLGTLDAQIARYLEHPPKGKAKRVLDFLRIGMAQMLILGTPAHAAVAATVAAARADGLDGMAGLLNAVLRKVSQDSNFQVTECQPDLRNLPDWLRDDWTRRFGSKTVQSIAQVLLQEPPLDLTVPNEIDAWCETLGGKKIGPHTVRLSRAGPVTSLPGYDSGAWWVQDVAAAQPARFLGDISGKKVLDLCAAPGGKTAQLIHAGAHVTALDRSKPRLARLKENLTRLDMAADIIAADATKWRPEELFDAILLDAPCSATGTLRRHPEIAHRRDGADLSRLTALQERLLEAAIQMLQPGGVLVVVTCSLQIAEGPALWAKAQQMPGVTAAPITIRETEGIGLIEDGSWVTHPGLLQDQGGMDGFTAFRLRKD